MSVVDYEIPREAMWSNDIPFVRNPDLLPTYDIQAVQKEVLQTNVGPQAPSGYLLHSLMH